MDGSAPGDVAASEAAVDAIGTDADLLPTMPIPMRMAGDRTPLSATCDPADESRCLLPWPSNVFTVRDATRGTGLRVNVEITRLVNNGDEASSFGRADGFSRVTSVLTALRGVVDEASLGDGITGAVRLIRTSPGPRFGEQIQLRIRSTQSRTSDRPETVIVGAPKGLLDAATDYAVVLLNTVRVTDGEGPVASHWTQAALGLTPAMTGSEARAFAYHAPTRDALTRAGIMGSQVLRVWDFTTRSSDDSLALVRTMRAGTMAAVTAGSVRVVIDRVTVPASGTIAAVVLGRLTGVPDFLDRTRRTIARDAQGRPVAMGTHDAPFRVTIPTGTGGYRAVLFGHGLGGDFDDDAFDTEISMVGAAKVGVRFAGLTSMDVLETLGGFNQPGMGSEWVLGLGAQSLADISAIQTAFGSVLRDALAAPMLGTTVNPAAGRMIDTTRATWAGGSLGGTMGYVYAQIEPSIEGAVLNVPGAAWTQYLVLSSVFGLARGLLLNAYRNDVNVQLGIAMAQTNLDGIDGALWSGSTMARRVPLLVQQSMGDPVLPAVGTEMVAITSGAQQVGAPLSTVYGVSPAAGDRVANGVGFTQYRVPSTLTGMYDVHGFGARNSPAGVAAREQILAFLQSVWAGSPVVTLPPSCVRNTPANSCDFAAAR